MRRSASLFTLLMATSVAAASEGPGEPAREDAPEERRTTEVSARVAWAPVVTGRFTDSGAQGDFTQNLLQVVLPRWRPSYWPALDASVQVHSAALGAELSVTGLWLPRLCRDLSCRQGFASGTSVDSTVGVATLAARLHTPARIAVGSRQLHLDLSASIGPAVGLAAEVQVDDDLVGRVVDRMFARAGGTAALGLDLELRPRLDLSLAWRSTALTEIRSRTEPAALWHLGAASVGLRVRPPRSGR